MARSGRQAAGALPIHLKPGVVDLMPAGIHGGADLRRENPARFQAMDSKVEQPAQGLVCAAQASPLAVATPMRSPVKDPGPAATAITSRSAGVRPQPCSRCSHHGQQGVAVGQAAVLEGLGNEGFVLAQGGGGRHGGGFQS